MIAFWLSADARNSARAASVERRSLPKRSISHVARNRTHDPLTGVATRHPSVLRPVVKFICGENKDRVADSLSFSLDNALSGDADVVVGLQRFLDQVAKGLIVEEVEPFHITERGLSRLFFPGPKVRRGRHLGALSSSGPPCSLSSAAAKQTMNSLFAHHACASFQRRFGGEQCPGLPFCFP